MSLTSRHVRLAAGLALALGLAPGTAAANTINVPTDQPTIQAAVGVANPGDVVLVAPGTYVLSSTVNANVSNLTIQGSGSGSTTVQVAGSVGFAFNITGVGATLRDLAIQKTDLVTNHQLVEVGASNVTVRDNLLYGPDPGTPWSANGLVSRGLEVQGGLSGLLVQGNTFRYLRQPAYVNPGTSGSIINNNVSGTRGWVVDGAALSFSGNTWGPPENQGAEIALLASCTAANYPDLLALSSANSNAYISGQFTGASSGRATAYVNASAAPGGFGDLTTPYATIATGIANALPGGAVLAAAGTYTEQVVVNGKDLTLQGAGRAATTIRSPATLATQFTTRKPVVTAMNTADVEVRDLTVDGMGAGNTNADFMGVAFWNGGGKLLDCDVVGVRNTPLDGAQYGVAVYASNNTGGPYAVEVGGCTVTDWQKGGIALNAAGLTANVHDCVVTALGPTGITAQNGIQLYGSNGSITNCTVSGNYWTGGTWVACGLLLIGPGTVDVSGCTLSGNQYAVYANDVSGTLNGTAITATAAGTGYAPLALELYNDYTSTLLRTAPGASANAARVPPPAQPVADDAMSAATRPNAVLSNLMTYTVTGGCMTGPGTANSEGIDVYSAGADLQATISGVEIGGFDWGIGTGGAGGVSVNANHDRIAGNLTAGYYFYGPGAATNLAAYNWWGDAGGPGVGGANPVIGAGVVTSPYLVTGADANPGCGFTAGADNVVTVGPAPSCVSQEHACVTLPVTIARTTSDNIRGYSVTLHLSSNLALCSGIGSILQGTYLSSVAGTNYEVVDNGGGSYTVDCAILGSTCGATGTGGTLFTLAVMRNGSDGTGTVTLDAIVARDCDNAPVVATAGPALDITIDTASPAAPTALAASQVKTGNDADGTTKIQLAFTAPAGTSVEVYRAGYGHYPDYDEAGGAVPAAPAYPPSGAWTLTGVTASGQADEPPTRDFWYYVAFAKDGCGNVSAASTLTTGTLDYHLGDVVDPANVSPYGDNHVDGGDISRLGAHYGITVPVAGAYEYLDVGPTTNYSVNARPTTDHKIGFEDLMMFAINYSVVSAPQLAARPASVGADALALDVPEPPAVGGTFAVSVRMRGAGDVQGASVRLAYDPAVVEPVGVEAGALLQSQARGSVVLSPEPGTVDFALLGTGAGLAGEGEVASVQFRVRGEGAPGIALGQVLVRGELNQPIEPGRLASGGGDALPGRTELGPVFPNPALHSASLQLSLAREGAVRVAVYDLAGRRVRTLMDSVQPAGVRVIRWNGTGDTGARMAPGVYVIRLETAGVTQSRRVQYLP